MGLFSRKNNYAELMAISLTAEGLYSACVLERENALPELEFLSFYPKAALPWETLLERLVRESPAKRKRRSLLLRTGDYQIIALDTIGVPPEEMKDALRWRIKDMLDFPVDEASFDAIHIPGDVNAGGRNASMLAIVAKSQTIARHQMQFQDTKLPLEIIDIPEMAQRNISARLEPSGRGLAMLSFDESGGLLTVSFGGELYLSRRLDLNLQMVQNTVHSEQATAFERVSLEVQRSLDHFDRQHNYITTAKLLIAPMGAAATQLQEFLSNNMYLPVEVLNLADVLDLSKLPQLQSPDQQQAYFRVIGAAMRLLNGAA